MLADSGPPAVTGWPGAEVGPVEALLRWGAQVEEVGPAQSAGALLVPVTWEALVPLRLGSGGEAIVQRSGVNLVREIPA